MDFLNDLLGFIETAVEGIFHFIRMLIYLVTVANCRRAMGRNSAICRPGKLCSFLYFRLLYLSMYTG